MVNDKLGLIFDVDGVVADTEAVNALVTAQVLDELFDIKGVVREDFTAGVGRGAQEYVKAAARARGIELDEEQVQRAVDLRQENFMAHLRSTPTPAFPGVLELMSAALAAEDFNVAIATSSTREKSQLTLESAKIPYRQMVYINGSMVKNKKPDPELFLLAVEQLKIAAGNCAVIEDAPNGVAAAKAAGCKCIAVTNSFEAQMLTQADSVVKSLTEVDLAAVRKLILSGK